MSALIISSLQANAFAASYGSYEYTLENEWEPVWPSGLQNEMGYSATGLGCGEVTTGDEGEEKWEQPDLKYLTEIAEHEGGGNVGDRTHLILQLHGADAATTASESLFVKDIHNNTWFRLGGIAEDATFVNATGETVREGDYTPIRGKLAQGSEVKLSIIAPHSESQTEGGLLAGYNIEQLKGVLERVTPLLDEAGPITKGISIDILASGKKAVNPERPGSIHRELADMLTKTFKEHGGDVTLRLRGKATREVMIEGKKANQILIDGEWKSDSEELFRNQLREATLKWDQGTGEYRATSASPEEVSRVSERLHELLADNTVENKVELVNAFVDRFVVDGVENTTERERTVSLLEKFVQLKVSMQYINEHVNSGSHSGVFIADIDESIKRGMPVGRDIETGTERNFAEDSEFMAHARKIKAFFNSEDLSKLNISKTGSASLNESLPEAEAVSTMDAAFLVQMLLDGKKTKYGTEITSDAYKAIYYSQLTRTGLGVLTNGIKFAELVGQAAGYTAELSSSLRALSKVSSVMDAVGPVFDAVNIGMDIWALAEAKTPTEKAVAGAQLGVDSASIGISLGLMASGYGEVAAPIAGLAIGINALVQNYSQLQIEHDKTVNQFAHWGDVVGAPYLYQNGMWTPNGEKEKKGDIVVKSINLKNKEVALGSSYVPGHKGGAPILDTVWFSCPSADWNNWIDFYPALDESPSGNLTYSLPTIPNGSQNTALVLPHGVTRYYKMARELSPGSAMWSHSDKGVRYLDEIKDKNDSAFMWRYLCGQEYIYDIKNRVEYENTNVEVVLDSKKNTIIVPGVKDSIRGYLSYQLQGSGGENEVILNPYQPSLTLNSSKNDQWILDLSTLAEDKKLTSAEGVASLLKQIELGEGGRLMVAGKEYARFNNLGSDKSNIIITMTIDGKSLSFFVDGNNFIGLGADIIDDGSCLISKGVATDTTHFQYDGKLYLKNNNRSFSCPEKTHNEGWFDDGTGYHCSTGITLGDDTKALIKYGRLYTIKKDSGSSCPTKSYSESNKVATYIEDMKRIVELSDFKGDALKNVVVHSGNTKATVFFDSGLVVATQKNSGSTTVSLGHYSANEGINLQALPISAEFDAEVQSVDVKGNDIVVTTSVNYGDKSTKDSLSYKLYQDGVFRPSSFVELSNRGYINGLLSVSKGPSYSELMHLISAKGASRPAKVVATVGKLSAISDAVTLPEAKNERLLATLKPFSGYGAVTYSVADNTEGSILHHAILEDESVYSGQLTILSGVAMYRPGCSSGQCHNGFDVSTVLKAASIYGIEDVVFDTSGMNGYSLLFPRGQDNVMVNNVYITGVSQASSLIKVLDKSSAYAWAMKGKDWTLASKGSDEAGLPLFRNLIFSNTLGSGNKGKLDKVSVAFSDTQASLSQLMNSLPMVSAHSLGQVIAGMKFPGQGDSDKSLVFFADGKIASLTKTGGKTALSEIKEVGSLFNGYPESRQLAASLVNLEKPNIVYLFWNDKERYGRYNTNDNGYFESTSSWLDNFHDWPTDKNGKFMQVAAIVPHLTNPNYAYFFWADGKTYGRYKWDEDKFDRTDSTAERWWSGYPKGKQVKAIIPQPNSVLATFVFEDGYTADFDFGKDEFVR